MEVTQFSRDIKFTSGYCPHAYSVAFESFLYNEPKFIQSKFLAPPLSFYILHTKKKMVLARIHFSIQQDEAVSLPQSPFGGLEINSDISLAILDEFIDFIEQQLKAEGIKSIIIKQFAFIYSTEASSKIFNVCIRKGFMVTHPDINHHIMVDNTSFFDKVHPMEQRKIKKAQSKSFIFREQPVDQLARAYEFILRCRVQKRQNLNITLANLNQAIKTMPKNYRIFTLCDGDEIIACSVIVIVNERIAYNFLPASDISYNKLSPMVFLIANLYRFCHERGIEILDLGISSIDNVLQKSLILFKERLGSLAGLKPTFKKVL